MGTDLHGIYKLKAQRRILYHDGCANMVPKIPGNEDDWVFDGLVTVEKMEHTSLHGKFRNGQNAFTVKLSMLKEIFNASNVSAAHWQENLCAAGATYAAERQTALEKLEKSRRNMTLQRARGTFAEKISAELRERMMKVMRKKKRPTTR